MKRTDCTDPFLRGYLDAALFTTDPEPPSGQDYVECGRSADMFPALPDYFLEQAKVDCAKFEAENTALLEQAGDCWQNGCDFWYTRNGHGCGFWDRGYADEIGDTLSEAARKCGSHDLDLETIEEEN
jgi:hypothetical protein